MFMLVYVQPLESLMFKAVHFKSTKRKLLDQLEQAGVNKGVVDLYGCPVHSILFEDGTSWDTFNRLHSKEQRVSNKNTYNRLVERDRETIREWAKKGLYD